MTRQLHKPTLVAFPVLLSKPSHAARGFNNGNSWWVWERRQLGMQERMINGNMGKEKMEKEKMEKVS